MCDDVVDYGDQVGVVGLKSSVWGHVLDDIIKECVHLSFLRESKIQSDEQLLEWSLPN